MVVVGTAGGVAGATMMAIGSLVRQSGKRELVGTEDTEGGGLASLQQEGWCQLRDALAARTLADSLDSYRAGVEAGTSSRRLRQAGFWQSSLGRFHLQTFSPGDEDRLAEAEQAWLPLVQARMPGILRSDLQLLFSLPESRDQIFHQDNSRPGLTVWS